MKILLLSNPDSAHTIKWVKGLLEKKIDIHLFGIGSTHSSFYEGLDNIKMYNYSVKKEIISNTKTTFKKLIYLFATFKLKKIITQIKPDLIHAHYCSSYGFLAALTGFHPFILSVWGSDIFRFPKESFLKKLLVSYVLKRADHIVATSKSLAKETNRYTKKKIYILPFGVDLDIFKKKKVKSPFNGKNIVIGTIKSLEKIYGVNYLIQSFKIFKDKYPNLSLKLLIVGDGSCADELKMHVKKLGLENDTLFTGYIEHENISEYHNMITVFVALSLHESFGVSIIEASACANPVITSNIEGLQEVVEDGITGYLVPKENVDKTVESLERLIYSKGQIEIMGQAGRRYVEKYFDWNNSLRKMISIYEKVVSEAKTNTYNFNKYSQLN